MSTPTVDRRVNSEAETVEENLVENTASDDMVAEGAPPLVVLSPAELALRDAEAAGTATPEEVEAELAKGKELQAKMEQEEAALRQTLQEQGPCVLLRFEHGNSLSYLVTPGQPVSDRALLAACNDLVTKINVAQARELWYNYDE